MRSDHFKEIDGVKRITLANACDLDFLNNLRSPDSYSVSPAYYLMTGRRGLWRYSRESENILFCIHPNQDGVILLFNPARSDSIVHHFLENPILASWPARICRVDQPDHYPWQQLEEDILDWRFPVCILDTGQVSALAGSKFADLRNQFNRGFKQGFSLFPYAPELKGKVSDLIGAWKEPECQEPYRELLEIIESCSDRNQGVIAMDGGKAIGFVHFETPLQNDNPANSLSLICAPGYRGLEEFMMVVICKRLRAQGIKRLNIGGSESQGLHRFKMKFNPVQIPLVTLAAFHGGFARAGI